MNDGIISITIVVKSGIGRFMDKTLARTVDAKQPLRLADLFGGVDPLIHVTATSVKLDTVPNTSMFAEAGPEMKITLEGFVYNI